MEKKRKAKKSDEKLTHEQALDRRRAQAPDYAGLSDLTDGEVVRAFVNAVEEAFAVLHQGSATLDEEEGDDTIDLARFSEWSQTVEDRFEFMGIQRRATNMAEGILSGPGSTAAMKDVGAAGLRLWTKSVYARFAALGQTIE